MPETQLAFDVMWPRKQKGSWNSGQHIGQKENDLVSGWSFDRRTAGCCRRTPAGRNDRRKTLGPTNRFIRPLRRITFRLQESGLGIWSLFFRCPDGFGQKVGSLEGCFDDSFYAAFTAWFKEVFE